MATTPLRSSQLRTTAAPAATTIAQSTSSTSEVLPQLKGAETVGDLLIDESLGGDEVKTMLMAMSAKKLRTECYNRQLRIVKKGSGCNDNKVGYVTLLLELKQALARLQHLGVEAGRTKVVMPTGRRRTRHCMIRLLNVMFSQRFCDRLGELDRRPTRAELDTNQTQAGSSIWVEILDEYLADRPEYGRLVTDLVTFKPCNPNVIVPHDASKLRDMWKDVTSRFNTALANSRISGNHDNDFSSYCSGKLDVLYLHEWLQHKPGALDSVEDKLPKRARFDTMAIDSGEDSSDQSPTKQDVMADLLATLDRGSESTQALELDVRLAQVVGALNTLMTLRERIYSALKGIYNEEVIADVIKGKNKTYLIAKISGRYQ